MSLLRRISLLNTRRVLIPSCNLTTTTTPASTQSTSSTTDSYVPIVERVFPWTTSAANKARATSITSVPMPFDPKNKGNNPIKRTGVIGKKMGMISLWGYWGERVPCTVIQVDDCQVIQIKNDKTKDGLVGIQMGAGSKKIKKVGKAELGHYKAAGVAPKQQVVEFKVTPDAVLPVGFTMSARHFVPGQYVDISGITVGKGFQGAMKRHGFSGQNASHGVSVTHRSLGSTGCVVRVFKGKRMPGHMGTDKVTVLNLLVYKIDVKRNLLYVVGNVPGFAGNFVTVRDAVKKRLDAKNLPPYPTYVSKPGEPEVEELVMEAPKEDPFAFGDSG